ncbi:MAG: Uma2 family endonuclease [Iphinoe sp. HA4291-MV1]|jgi:Uma2 family endonuclease|nr:Uma2 family endonuclease [Iphinoe sp. HA4291-MV1]
MVVDIRRWTVAEYHRMGELGFFAPDEQVELIEGQIFNKPVKGTSHSAAVSRIDRLLRNHLRDTVLIRLQDPVQLDDYSEPEPDVAVVQQDPLYYEDHHPTSSEIYLIIEVADSTLTRDTEFKALAYAKANIADYWVLDVNKRQLYVFRQPSEEGYQVKVILSDTEAITPLAFADVRLAVSEMLRPL